MYKLHFEKIEEHPTEGVLDKVDRYIIDWERVTGSKISKGQYLKNIRKLLQIKKKKGNPPRKCKQMTEIGDSQ